jgi:hypothetical protein
MHTPKNIYKRRMLLRPLESTPEAALGDSAARLVFEPEFKFEKLPLLPKPPMLLGLGAMGGGAVERTTSIAASYACSTSCANTNKKPRQTRF